MKDKVLEKRVMAMTIDWMIASFIHARLLILILQYGYVSEIFPKIIMLPTNIHSIIYFLLVIIYYVIFEGLFGVTIGKKLFRLKLVDDDGNKPTFGAILLRNVFRISDQFLLVGSVFLFIGDSKKRLGDRVAGTNVVDKKSLLKVS